MPHQIKNLTPYTCFECLRTFKRSFDAESYYKKCPNCGAQAVQMDIRFQPPRKSDTKQWLKVRFLVNHGFIFQKIYKKQGSIWQRATYPSNLEQAKEFVIEFRDQALPIRVPHYRD